MDLNGVEHDFTAAEAAKSEFSNLILRSGIAYTFAWDGYGTSLSANLSVTKEIGDHVSLSFFANNFTNSRMSVKSKATGRRSTTDSLAGSNSDRYETFYKHIFCKSGAGALEGGFCLWDSASPAQLLASDRLQRRTSLPHHPGRLSRGL